MSQRSISPKILWLQVWGLAAVQGAIALTWVIYNLYLKNLLVELGFPPGLATSILILENVLAAVMEPLMGGFSDQAQRWVGSRFPFIALGIVLASVLFIAIPSVVLFGNSARWLLPVILVGWALAMTVFRSPALSLLGRYAFATKLPQAASILTLVGGVAGAMGPLANQFILGLGAMATFGIGSITLLGGAIALNFVNPNGKVQETSSLESEESQSQSRWGELSLNKLVFVFGTGIGVGLGFRLLMQTFPKVLKAQVPDANISFILGGIFIALALTAIPSGTLATRLGNRLAMMYGLGGMAGFTALMSLTGNGVTALGIAIALGGTLSLVFNGTIPFALSMVPEDRGGLGTGIYFSGGAVANSIFGAVFSQPDAITPMIGVLLGTFAFALAGVLVAISGKPVK